MLASLELPAYRAHPLLPNPHLMTLSLLLPRRGPRLARSESRCFAVNERVELLALADWQTDPAAPLLLLVHGLCGSARSSYMLGTARKAFSAGFHVLRLNMRGCGGTERMSRDLYHSGLTSDIDRVLAKLIAEGHQRLYLAGFSMGGNQVLKLAGEWQQHAPREIRGLLAISPPVDVSASAAAIDSRPMLRPYRRSFLKALASSMLRRGEFWPKAYDLRGLRGLHSLREFDERYTAPASGFDGADDYYRRASSLSLLDDIAVPSLLIASRDDPLVPFGSLQTLSRDPNSPLRVVATMRGGHCAFVARSDRSEKTDGHWAENRIVQFCRHIETKTRYG